MSELINTIERQLGKAIPELYATYLEGCEEILRDDGLLIYDGISILERNETLGVQRFISEFLAVGDDSAGRLIVIRFADAAAQPFLVDGGALVPGMPPSLLKPLSTSWCGWQTAAFPLPGSD